MTRPKHILIDGKLHLWSDILDLRRKQMVESADTSRQLLLFDLRHDPRPANERTAAQRYLEPTFHDLLSSRQ